MCILELIGYFLVIFSFVTIIYEIFKKQDWPSVTMWINRFVHGGSRSKNVNVDYVSLIKFSKRLDIESIESWSKKNQKPLNFQKNGEYRYTVTSDKRPNMSGQIIYHFDENTGSIGRATVTIKDTRRGKKISGIITDTHAFGIEINEKLNFMKKSSKTQKIKESFKLDLGRAPETQYFLYSIGLSRAQGMTKKGYKINIYDNYIEIESEVFNHDEINEIKRLAKLA